MVLHLLSLRSKVILAWSFLARLLASSRERIRPMFSSFCVLYDAVIVDLRLGPSQHDFVWNLVLVEDHHLIWLLSFLEASCALRISRSYHNTTAQASEIWTRNPVQHQSWWFDMCGNVGMQQPTPGSHIDRRLWGEVDGEGEYISIHILHSLLMWQWGISLHSLADTAGNSLSPNDSQHCVAALEDCAAFRKEAFRRSVVFLLWHLGPKSITAVHLFKIVLTRGCAFYRLISALCICSVTLSAFEAWHSCIITDSYVFSNRVMQSLTWALNSFVAIFFCKSFPLEASFPP